MRRPTWQVAIDWHLVPYYGEPQHSRNEIYYGKPKQGTSHFHAYATACIVQYGERYTLALTWVRRHESTVVVLRRLLAQDSRNRPENQGFAAGSRSFSVAPSRRSCKAKACRF